MLCFFFFLAARVCWSFFVSPFYASRVLSSSFLDLSTFVVFFLRVPAYTSVFFSLSLLCSSRAFQQYPLCDCQPAFVVFFSRVYSVSLFSLCFLVCVVFPLLSSHVFCVMANLRLLCFFSLLSLPFFARFSSVHTAFSACISCVPSHFFSPCLLHYVFAVFVDTLCLSFVCFFSLYFLFHFGTTAFRVCPPLTTSFPGSLLFLGLEEERPWE